MSLSALFAKRLPVNRKEVYYTATVFPCIVCVDGFAHIHRLWKLLGIEAPHIDAGWESPNIQFLTEYNAKQSIHVEFDKTRFPVEISSGETPDILILIDGQKPMLISIEAKMFDSVETSQLKDQLDLQLKNVLQPLKSGLAQVEVLQVALVPKEMGVTHQSVFPAKLLHWEQVRDAFADVTSASYFVGVLGLALDNYSDLRNKKLVFHVNMQEKMTGMDISKKTYSDGEFPFLTMGRKGGLEGAPLAQDLASGAWRSYFYELNTQSKPINRNWFAISDFISRLPKSADS